MLLRQDQGRAVGGMPEAVSPAHPDQHREAAKPLHDEWSHGADAFRYMAASAEQMTNEEWGGTLNYRKLGIA